MLDIKTYKTIIFDCDGVILNSNKVKEDAFYQNVLPYGKLAAQQLLQYHLKFGGKSRYDKFDYFFSNILKRRPEKNETSQLLNLFAEKVRTALLECEVAKGIDRLRLKTSKSKWMIVSGGDQRELRDVFSVRSIADYFDGGIYGSPDNKEIILERETGIGNIVFPALFIGDSKYDYEVSKMFNMDFIFVYQWSTFNEWKGFFKDKKVMIIDSISNL
jgi:phosphoglycolate phosphatase-like HAD superfamily hydrolase